MNVGTILLSLLLAIHIAFAAGSFIRSNTKPSIFSFFFVFISMPFLIIVGCIDFLHRVHGLLREQHASILQYLRTMRYALLMCSKFIPQLAEDIMEILIGARKYQNKYLQFPLRTCYNDFFKEYSVALQAL